MAISDGDLAISLIIAALILVVLTCYWPGFARVRGEDLAGYWAAPDGGLFEVRDAGGRGFVLQGVARGAGSQAYAGEATGVRQVAVAGKRGRLELDGRRIRWADGVPWTRQGVRA